MIIPYYSDILDSSEIKLRKDRDYKQNLTYPGYLSPKGVPVLIFSNHNNICFEETVKRCKKAIGRNFHYIDEYSEIINLSNHPFSFDIKTGETSREEFMFNVSRDPYFKTSTPLSL